MKIVIALFTVALLTLSAMAQSYVPASGDDASQVQWKMGLAWSKIADYYAGVAHYEEAPLTIMLTSTNPAVIKGYGTNGACLSYFFESFTGGGEAANAAVGTNQQVYAKLTLPGGWVEGTAITPRIHWAQTVTNGLPGIAGALTASNVVFGVEYMWLPKDGTVTTTTTSYITNAVSKTNWVHQASSFTAITNATGKVYDEILFRFFRQGTNVYNTYTNDVALIKLGVSVQVNSYGSTTATTK